MLLRSLPRLSAKGLRHNLHTNAVDREKKFRVVIVGTGWAGYKLLTNGKAHRADIEAVIGKNVEFVVVSQRNHFLYTPLLASTTVGTLEFRSITEPVRENAFRDEKDFILASVTEIDAAEKKVHCVSSLCDSKYTVDYDMLVVACGSRPLTFGLPGVEEHAFFLKEVHHARAIRQRILENFELATQPGVTEAVQRQLLHFIVVGGGPTGVEFCAELYDFVVQDLTRLYPQVTNMLQVSLIDAGDILSMFNQSLRDRAMTKIQKRKSMRVIKANCKEVRADAVILDSGETIPCGLVVWSAGVGPNVLTKSLPWAKSKRGNILTNEYCQVMGVPPSPRDKVPFAGLPLQSSVFAIGDCADIQDYPLPATAQKAQGQAEYLLSLLQGQEAKPYRFESRGLMAYLGSYEGLFQAKDVTIGGRTGPIAKFDGWKAWFVWRSAYLTKLGSWRLRMQVPLDWLKAMVVGRDVSRF
ncbi:NADH-ubiquinone oxidoreductase [Achlya hypogyna]|uniref:NADH-ubiquinone oxidoreductase n=1 Tax=Achlya hypogyna TaxID=1202772 RepID=A0A1V9YXX9_ACHHY|nr:NADH-ubiquinone oxidoreductase [Achlya hypogyna]